MSVPTMDFLKDLQILNDEHPLGIKKFFLPFCQENLKENPGLTTKEWLTAQKILQKKVAIKAVLNHGDFNQESVVVKIGNREVIEKEFLRSRLLFMSGIEGFIPYICMFSCNDKITMYDYSVTNKELIENKGFCDGPPESLMSAIVMPYLDGDSIENNIKHHNLEFDKAIEYIKQVIRYLQNAFDTIGFIHRDTHLDNFFIHDSEDGPDVCIIDYGQSLIIPKTHNGFAVDRNNFRYYKILYSDFSRIIEELKAVYRGKEIFLHGDGFISQYLDEKSINEIRIEDSNEELFKLIDLLYID